jgi:hypothetical protein
MAARMLAVKRVFGTVTAKGSKHGGFNEYYLVYLLKV